ncbi:MAG: hypothetical protein BJ554DRAFT_3858, partial [Olpidium bornovanus]
MAEEGPGSSRPTAPAVLAEAGSSPGGNVGRHGPPARGTQATPHAEPSPTAAATAAVPHAAPARRASVSVPARGASAGTGQPTAAPRTRAGSVATLGRTDQGSVAPPPASRPRGRSSVASAEILQAAAAAGSIQEEPATGELAPSATAGRKWPELGGLAEKGGSAAAPGTPAARDASPACALPYAAERERQEAVFRGFAAEFEAVDRTLGEDEALRRVRQEFHRLRRVAVRSQEHGRVLYDDYAKLYGEWFNNVAHNKAAARAAVQDAQTIASLKEQIVAASERVRKCNADEDGILEQTRQVRYDITQLENVLKQGVGLSVSQERTMSELRANHAMTTRELEQELEMISHLRAALNDIVEKIRSTDMEKRDIERHIFEVKETHVRKKAEIDAELRTKERLEYDMRELRVVVGQKTSEVRAVQDQVNRANDDIGILEAQINSHRNSLERILNDQENLHVVMMKLQVDCDHQIAQTSQLYDENVKLASELLAREKELAEQKSEGKRINKIREGVMQKMAGFDQHKQEAESERQALRNRM